MFTDKRSFSGKKDHNAHNNQAFHFKREGRKLAMLFLYSSDLTEKVERPSSEELERFWIRLVEESGKNEFDSLKNNGMPVFENDSGAVSYDGISNELCSDDFIQSREFRKAKEYAEKLIEGVFLHNSEIMETLDHFSTKWDVNRMSIVDKNIMRIAIFELKYCPDIPALVSIDEAIEIGKVFSSEKSGVFINGILNGVKNSLPPGTKDNTSNASPKLI